MLDRAFRILAAFGPDDRSLSLTSLSIRSGIPKSSALRLARKLVEVGALERTTEGEFTIGLQLLEIASLAPRGHGIRSVALPYMQDLSHSTGQHVLLAVREASDAVLIERLSALHTEHVMYRVGGRLPLHATGVGVVLLAHAPLALQEEVLASELVLLPENEKVGPRELRNRLAATRRDGYTVVTRRHPEHRTSVAAPILGAGQTVVAALSLVGAAAELDTRAGRIAVVTVARAVSRAVQNLASRSAQVAES